MPTKITRMSIDISAKEHKKIKMLATISGTSIREFVINCIRKEVECALLKKKLHS